MKAETEARAASARPDIYALKEGELAAWVAAQGFPAYRAGQIADWLDKGVQSSEALHNLPRALRDALGAAFSFSPLRCVDELKSALDETRKYVFRLQDGNHIEAVYMEYRHGASVCVSSQVGCRMGCTFCASTRAGFARDLRAAEMLAQVRHIAARVPRRISHAVVMGIGEPLENLPELIGFLRGLHEPRRFNISYRHMTVSTCGLIPEMLNFLGAKLPVNLAVSLHAPEQGLRERLMPIARRYPLPELLHACRRYVRESGRRITFEYALFKGVNDAPEQAEALVRLLRGLLCHVNLIPANPFPGSGFQPSAARSVRRFQAVLEAAGLPCSLRRTLGRDIMAACGQLRRSREA